ncbi:MAG: hypothetical protein GXO95_03045 [Nitrospirae bacterium]|nr:hypothetical protein [Nitrospirota bacterium]
MPVDRINKVNETPVVRERPEITSRKEKKRKKQKDKGKKRKRKGIVDIMA